MFRHAAPRFVLGALVLGVLAGACGDILHSTNWDTCADVPEGCPGSSSDGGGEATGGASGTGGSVAAGGEGAGASGNGGGSISVAAACTKSATWSCNLLAECAQPIFDNFFGSDDAVCISGHVEACEKTGFAPGANFAPEDLSACVDDLVAYGSGSCADRFRLSSAQVIPDSCREPGTLRSGASCVSLHQCAGGACEIAATAPCGTCADTSGQDGPCDFVLDCEPNLACIGGVCEEPKDVGAACATTAECYVDLVCDAGTCVARKPLGAACNPAIGDCLNYFWCNGTTQICEAWGSAPLGAECGVLASGGLARCEPFTTCQLPDPTILKGTCVAIAEVGEPCTFDDGWFGPPCRWPARCIAGTCVVKDAAACE